MLIDSKDQAFLSKIPLTCSNQCEKFFEDTFEYHDKYSVDPALLCPPTNRNCWKLYCRLFFLKPRRYMNEFHSKLKRGSRFVLSLRGISQRCLCLGQRYDAKVGDFFIYYIAESVEQQSIVMPSSIFDERINSFRVNEHTGYSISFN